MTHISKKFRAFFLLPLPGFCMSLTKIAIFSLVCCFLLYWSFDLLSKHIYYSAKKYLIAQDTFYKNHIMHVYLKNEESDLVNCINKMQHQLLLPQQHRKRFIACLSKTNMTERSFTTNQRIKKTTIQPHEFCSYKISGSKQALDELFSIIKSTEFSGLFCKTIVLNQEGDDHYSVNLVFKEYMKQKK